MVRTSVLVEELLDAVDALHFVLHVTDDGADNARPTADEPKFVGNALRDEIAIAVLAAPSSAIPRRFPELAPLR